MNRRQPKSILIRSGVLIWVGAFCLLGVIAWVSVKNSIKSIYLASEWKKVVHTSRSSFDFLSGELCSQRVYSYREQISAHAPGVAARKIATISAPYACVAIDRSDITWIPNAEMILYSNGKKIGSVFLRAVKIDRKYHRIYARDLLYPARTTSPWPENSLVIDLKKSELRGSRGSFLVL